MMTSVEDRVLSVEFYFSDLNEEAQKELLDAVGVSGPEEMNWDMDILPIAFADYNLDDED